MFSSQGQLLHHVVLVLFAQTLGQVLVEASLLGVEERLTVERKLVRREVDKTRLRDRRQIQYGYEISVTNLLTRTVDVEIHDHVPVARHEEITVKLLNSSPDPTERSEMNLMEWLLSMPLGAAKEVRYEYQVEHPRSLRVTGLVD